MERSVGDAPFKPSLAIKHMITKKERERKIMRNELECGIWMGFGQLDQEEGWKWRKR